MKEKIKIDIVSDVVCPWCLIGYKRLERAISEIGIEDTVEIQWHPFELNPDMPTEGEDAQIYRARKYGASPEDTLRSQAYLMKLGAELGFTFDFFEKMKLVNTQDAHILLDYAKEFGLQTKLNIRLAEAFFADQKDISDREILDQELRSVGLNAEEALQKLDDTNAREQIQTQKAYWRSLGVSGVPTMIFDGSTAVNGAQSVDTYKQVLAECLDSNKIIES